MRIALLTLATAVWLSGCPDPDPDPGPDPDAAMADVADMASEAGPVVVDLGPIVDRGPIVDLGPVVVDLGTDVGPVVPDLGPDVGPDVGPDMEIDAAPPDPCAPGGEPALDFGDLNGAAFTAFAPDDELIIEDLAQAGTVTRFDLRALNVGEQAGNITVTLRAEGPDGALYAEERLGAPELLCNPGVGRFLPAVTLSTFGGAPGETVYLQATGTFVGVEGEVEVTGGISLIARFQ